MEFDYEEEYDDEESEGGESEQEEITDANVNESSILEKSIERKITEKARLKLELQNELVRLSKEVRIELKKFRQANSLLTPFKKARSHTMKKPRTRLLTNQAN